MTTPQRVAVAGGTGCLGRHVVEAVRDIGMDAVVLARSTGVDLTTGAGLIPALDGVDVVVDCTNLVTLRARTAIDFFETVTGHLTAAAHTAGVGHLVVVSVVGSDHVDYAYYLGKRAQERVALEGPTPATVLRATQFHEFAAQLLAGRSPLVLVPRMLSQPVAAREVATELVRLAGLEPVGLAPEMAGPEEHLQMDDMVRRLLARRGSRRRVLALKMPGSVGDQMVGGGLLPTTPGPRGVQTFDDWLNQQ